MKTKTLIAVFKGVLFTILLIMLIDAIWCDRWDKVAAYWLMAICFDLGEIKSKL